MGVAGELAMAVQAAHEEAEDDLAEPVAVLLRAVLELLEARALDELASRARARGDRRVTTSGTTMNGWPRKMRASERWFCASSS